MYRLSISKAFDDRIPPLEEMNAIREIRDQCCLDSGSCFELNRILDSTDTAVEGNFCHAGEQACDEDGHIVALRLQAENLECEFPRAIANLTKLRRLDMSDNYLYGSFQDVYSAMQDIDVESLHFGRNDFELQLPCFPSEGKIRGVSYLDLSFNRIDGQLRSCVFGPNMEIVTLEGNFISGEFPNVLNPSTAMRHLDVSWQEENVADRFNGVLPDFTVWPNLEYLSLAENAFNGTFPPLPDNLRTLRLEKNKLSGPLPESLTWMKGLKLLDIQENQFSGLLPTEMPSTLLSLQLGENLLMGTIPTSSWFKKGNGMFGLTELRLGGNRLTGFIPPELATLRELWALNLTGNILDGSLDAFVASLPQKNKFLQFEAGSNMLTGSIPQDITALYMLRGEVDPPSNRGRGRRPSFVLSGNQLSGEIPASLLKTAAAEQSMMYFDISRNSFVCPSQYLDLTRAEAQWPFLSNSGIGRTTCLDDQGMEVLLADDQNKKKPSSGPDVGMPQVPSIPELPLTTNIPDLPADDLVDSDDLDDKATVVQRQESKNSTAPLLGTDGQVRAELGNKAEDVENNGSSLKGFPITLALIIGGCIVGALLVSVTAFFVIWRYRQKSGKAYLSYDGSKSPTLAAPGIPETRSAVVDLEQPNFGPAAGDGHQFTMTMAERSQSMEDVGQTKP